MGVHKAFLRCRMLISEKVSALASEQGLFPKNYFWKLAPTSVHPMSCCSDSRPFRVKKERMVQSEFKNLQVPFVYGATAMHFHLALRETF